MASETANWAQLNEALEGLRQEVGRLSQRVAALEKVKEPEVSRIPESAGATASSLSAPDSEALPEEIVLVLGAAVAAFLGKRAPIRQIRLLGTAAWAQQGRVTIQASHNR